MAPAIAAQIPNAKPGQRAASKSTVTSRGLGGEPPAPPAGVDYPADFKFKRCKRCGVWNCAASPYDQSESPEHAWGAVIAWEGGSIFNPLGGHCLMCRKAGAMSRESGA